MAGNQEVDPKKQLDVTLKYLESLSKEDPEKLKKTLYDSFSALSYLILEGKKAKFRSGWASEVKDRHGDPIFDKGEAQILESVSLNLMKPMFEKDSQKGGNPEVKPPSLKAFSTKGMIDTKATPGIGVNPDDISLDKTFWKVKDFLTGLDKQAHDLSRSMGPFRFFYDMPTDIRVPIPIPIPSPPFVIMTTFPVSPRAIPVIIGALVETIRLLFSVGNLSNDTARKVLSFVMAIIDLLKGDWKHSILSLIGYWGQYPLMAGIIGKTFLNVFDLISPDIQDRIIFDVYQSGKSMTIGFFLWAFATFSTDPLRTIARKQFDLIKEMVDNSNEQSIEEVWVC